MESEAKKLGFSPGVNQPLTGWPWYEEHKHDLDGWTPRFELALPGLRYSIQAKNHKTINDVMRVNK